MGEVLVCWSVHFGIEQAQVLEGRMLRQLLKYWGEFFAEVARRGVYIDNCILLGLYLFHKVFLGEVSDGRESS